MMPLIEVAKELQDFLEDHELKFCFIGGFALQRWGEQRLTVDVDLSVFTGFGDERTVATTLLERFPMRHPEALDFALRHRVLLVKRGDVGVDIAFAALPRRSSSDRRFAVMPPASDCVRVRPKTWL